MRMGWAPSLVPLTPLCAISAPPWAVLLLFVSFLPVPILNLFAPCPSAWTGKGSVHFPELQGAASGCKPNQREKKQKKHKTTPSIDV